VPVVTCVGLAVADLVFSINGTLEVGQKNFASDVRPMGGGPAANAAVAVASLGGTANLVSVLGGDLAADEIIELLGSRGVLTDRVRRNRSSDSPQSVVIADGDGERTIVNRTDGRLWEGMPVVSASDIEGSDSVLVDLRWLDGATSAIRHAAEAGIPTVVDYDLTDVDAPDSVLQLASHVVFSEPALFRLTGLTDPLQAIESVTTGSDFAGVTLGPRGVVWREDGRTHHIDAFDVDVTNTLGAGDVFHGAFALGLAEGRDIEEIIRWSSAAAAIKCTGRGARDGFPTRENVTKLLEETKT
jgi:sulfofructose kinase